MAIVGHDIAEHDVALRVQVGDWPAGTEGTAVSTYEDPALVELSGMPTDEPVDNLIVFPTDKLDVVWRPVIRPAGNESVSRRDRVTIRSTA
jgi:hypothetical protein